MVIERNGIVFHTLAQLHHKNAKGFSPQFAMESTKTLDARRCRCILEQADESMIRFGGIRGRRFSRYRGSAGVGVVIEGAPAGPIRIAKWIGRQDSNVAEYVALMEALQCALALKARRLHVYSDSEVVVKQMTGVYKCRSPRLYSLNWT